MSHITIIGLVAALTATMLWALYDTICKKQTETENTVLQACYVHFFVFLFYSPFTFYSWVPVHFADIVGLILITLVGLLSIMVLFLGYKFAPIVTLIPFSYSRILFAMIFSYLIYDVIPTYECILGGTIIFLAELYYYISERKVSMNLKRTGVYVK